ncbi:MAG: thiol reductant ABC exporter subunit CydD [gamma proteobacterium symbiont of Stewartia floridana]|nr:MAG: thiol reductant ABC exporter subunit CydD [gamma proteobacterium symbiont of Stewartia floridana]RLW69622.1 MAG: thiol reductant ABC exporter subunit CydD [gamma proteobacterium symbiont of Stewartia floridana]
MTGKFWLKRQRGLAGNALVLATVLGTLSGWLILIQAWLLSQVIAGVIIEHQSLQQQLPPLGGMLAVFLARAALIWASEQSAFVAASRVKQSLRQSLQDQLRRLGPAYLANHSSGQLVNTMTDGIEALEAYYARYLPAISLMALVPFSILVFIFPIDWLSALVMGLTAPLIPLFMILIGRGAERRNQRQWRQLARMSGHFLDTIQGLTSLKLFNASRKESRVIARISDEYRHSTLSVLRIAFLSSFALEFFSTISIAIVAVLVGFRLYWGELDLLYGFFVLLLAPEFYLPLRNMGQHYHARMEAIGATDGMLDILQATPHNSDRQTTSKQTGKPLELRFENVAYRYADGRQALQKIDFTLNPGEQVALVGPSGAGKTTLLNLILGFNSPTHGQIRINQQPLQSIDLEAWRRQIIWLPQKPQLFHGTVAENIRLADPGAEMARVEQAAKLAGADQFIQRLPEGYESLIGEGGRTLSGGETRRIALARAFLKDAPLVILDEATASLDLQSEQQVQAAIERLALGRTLMIVAHRLKTVQSMRRILVMHEGRIVESGNHHTLLQQPGLYRTMVMAAQGETG